MGGEAFTRIEKAVTQYLYEFGATREADLIKNVSKQEEVCSDWVKKVIAKLYRKKVINKIKHPNNEVYLTLEKNLRPLELEKQLVKAQATVRAAELQAYGMIDSQKQKKMPNIQQKTITETVEELIQTKKDLMEAIEKLKKLKRS